MFQTQVPLQKALETKLDTLKPLPQSNLWTQILVFFVWFAAIDVSNALKINKALYLIGLERSDVIKI